ncbi:MAG: rhomboid family intramembrane serine protease [Anaerolineales bacterium]|nr:rhomboid family intramembrane serine protease [Anaerolineales bacterium]
MIPIQDMNPSRTKPVITWVIIALNVIVYLYEIVLDGMGQLDPFLYQAGVVPSLITTNLTNIPDIFTSMFLHGGWIHLLGNMLYLWIFGDNIEDRMGHGRFLVFYLVGGVLASVAQIIVSPGSNVPIIGASGAIAAVLGAYLVEYPRARVRSLLMLGYFIRFVHIPAVVVLGFWFVLQFFNGFLSLSSMSAGGVAYFAHIGGFVAGMILVKLFTIGRPKVSDWDLPRY